MKYEIIYDHCGEFEDETNLSEIFEGTWSELQDYIKRMRSKNCYNIDAYAIEEE